MNFPESDEKKKRPKRGCRCCNRSEWETVRRRIHRYKGQLNRKGVGKCARLRIALAEKRFGTSAQ